MIRVIATKMCYGSDLKRKRKDEKFSIESINEFSFGGMGIPLGKDNIKTFKNKKELEKFLSEQSRKSPTNTRDSSDPRGEGIGGEKGSSGENLGSSNDDVI